MTTNLQSTSFLPKQKNFPNDNSQVLGVELDKAYIEIASRLNERTIGTFGVNFPITTGEQWYIVGGNQKQHTLRQVYIFTSTNTIAHGINLTQMDRFTRAFGEFTDGTNWYGAIHGSNVAIVGQISFFIDPTNITFLVGAGAPVVNRGNIVLEWLSQF
jgi:hypothetical protein